MRPTLVCLFLVLFCLADLSIQQITHVPICASPDGYNIMNLTKYFDCLSLNDDDIVILYLRPNYWTFDKDGGCVNDTTIFEKCTFLFSFCHSLSDITKCQNSSVCQWSLERPDDIFELGEYVYDPFEEKEVNGFYARFGTGEVVVNKFTNKTCNVSIVMEFDCDPSVPWISDGTSGVAPQPTAFSGISESGCEYYVKFPYAGACYRLITTTAYDPPPAKICIPPAKGYDITVLTEPPFWTIDITSGCKIEDGSTDACTIFIAFCKPFESLAGCNGSSACLKYPNKPGNSIVLGNYTGDPFTSAEANGFTASYPSGQLVMNPFTNKTCPVTVSVVFDCDPYADWELDDKTQPGKAPKPISFTSVTATSCEITVTVPYAGACIKIKPGKPIGGLSTGSILLILFFAGVFLYITVGFGYNTLVDKQSGAKALPHYEFWVTSGQYTKDGFVFIWKKLTCQRTTELVYNSI